MQPILLNHWGTLVVWWWWWQLHWVWIVGVDQQEPDRRRGNIEVVVVGSVGAVVEGVGAGVVETIVGVVGIVGGAWQSVVA